MMVKNNCYLYSTPSCSLCLYDVEEPRVNLHLLASSASLYPCALPPEFAFIRFDIRRGFLLRNYVKEIDREEKGTRL